MLNMLFFLFITTVFASEDIQAKPAIYCEGCQLLVGAIEKWISSNATETMIEKNIQQLCKLLPKYDQTCIMIVNVGIHRIIEYIVNLKTPSEICKHLGFCPVNQLIETIECEGCELFVGAIEKWIAQNDTIIVIEKQIEKLCDLLPKYTSICSAIIKFGIPKLIIYLETLETPEKVCQQIGLCPKTIKGDVICEDCKYIVVAIEQWISSGATVSVIIKNLCKLCEMLPKYGDLCDELVYKMVPVIIQYIERKEPADLICKQIKLCMT